MMKSSLFKMLYQSLQSTLGQMFSSISGLLVGREPLTSKQSEL
jgi:hypothetical protein